MRNLDGLLDGGELDLGVVVDPKDGVPHPGEGLQAACAELDLGGALPGSVGVVLSG